MKEIKVDKVTLNIGTGGPGEKLEKAMKLLNMITNESPIQTRAKRRIPTWGVRPGLAIGCKVTVRKENAVKLLKRLLHAVNNKLSRKKFDNFGNFSFGVKEYIEIPGVNYDPAVGIIGLDVAVTLKRPGYRVKQRSLKRMSVGKGHQITKEEAADFITEKFGIEVES